MSYNTFDWRTRPPIDRGLATGAPTHFGGMLLVGGGGRGWGAGGEGVFGTDPLAAGSVPAVVALYARV